MVVFSWGRTVDPRFVNLVDSLGGSSNIRRVGV